MVKVPLALVRELRAKLRDYPEINFLYQDEESSNQQLARNLHEALERFNLYPPILDTWAFENVPKIAIRFIIDIAIVGVLKELTIWMVRNQFQYQAGNTSVRLYDKWQAYQSIGQMMQADVEKQASNYKVQMNISGAWGENLTELYDSRWLRDSSSYIGIQV